MNAPRDAAPYAQQTASYEQPAPYDDEIDLGALFREARRYWFALISLPLICGISAAYWAMTQPKIYQATATLLIDKGASKQPVSDMYMEAIDQADYYKTQHALITSRTQIEKLVDKLKLDQRPEFAAVAPPWHLALLARFNLAEDDFEPPPPRAVAVARAREAASVRPELRTQLAYIEFESQDPELAAKAANMLADLYIDSTLQARLDATRRATSWLNEKLADISIDLKSAEGELQRFREKENLVVAGGSRGLIEEEISDLSRRLREATRERVELQNAYAQVTGAGGNMRVLENSSVLLVDPLVKAAQDRFLVVQSEQRSLEQRYGARHPQIAASRARLEEARVAYHEQLRIASQSLRERFEIAQRNENSLAGAVRRARSRIRNMDRQNFQVSVLERDVESNRQMYDTFLSRFKETETSGSYDEVNARIVDQALPGKQVRPRPAMSLAIGGVVGVMLALGLIVLRVQLRSRIESPDDVEKATSVPLIGVLPMQSKSLLGKLRGQDVDPQYVEAVRSVQAAIHVSDVDRHWKRIMVTSPTPEDGKSTLASTLATAFSAHEKVLLIDCDLRRPRQHKHFKIASHRPGLTEVLADRAKMAECIRPTEAGPHLLPSGLLPANAGEVISSAAFKSFIHDVSEQYDRIIFDTPPVSVVGDALMLLPLIDGLLLVVRSEHTFKKVLQGTLKRLAAAHAPIIGTVLNDARRRGGAGDGYYSGYYYDYKYK